MQSMKEKTDFENVKNRDKEGWVSMTEDNLDYADDDTIASSSETLVGDMPPVDSKTDNYHLSSREEGSFESVNQSAISFKSNFDQGPAHKISMTSTVARPFVIPKIRDSRRESHVPPRHPNVISPGTSPNPKACTQNSYQGPSCRPKERSKMKHTLKKSYSHQETLDPPTSPDRRASYSNLFSFTAEEFYRSRMVDKSELDKRGFTPPGNSFNSERKYADTYSLTPESRDRVVRSPIDMNGRNIAEQINLTFKAKYNFEPEIKLPVSVSLFTPLPQTINNSLSSVCPTNLQNQSTELLSTNNFRSQLPKSPRPRMKTLAKQASAADADLFYRKEDSSQKKMVKQNTFDHSTLNTTSEVYRYLDDILAKPRSYNDNFRTKKYPSLDIVEKNLEINDLAKISSNEPFQFQNNIEDLEENSDDSCTSSSSSIDSEEFVDQPLYNEDNYIHLDSDDTDDDQYLEFDDYSKPQDMTGSPESQTLLNTSRIPKLEIPDTVEEDDDSISEEILQTPDLLKPPDAVPVRRGSIVTCDTHLASLEPQSEPIKIIVLGDEGVGKTAVIVRLVTGRFIGDYDPSLEAIYSYTLPMGDSQHSLQIMDTAEQGGRMGELTQLKWADAVIVIFSITSEKSFQVAESILERLFELQEQQDKSGMEDKEGCEAPATQNKDTEKESLAEKGGKGKTEEHSSEQIIERREELRPNSEKMSMEDSNKGKSELNETIENFKNCKSENLTKDRHEDKSSTNSKVNRENKVISSAESESQRDHFKTSIDKGDPTSNEEEVHGAKPMPIVETDARTNTLDLPSDKNSDDGQNKQREADESQSKTHGNSSQSTFHRDDPADTNRVIIDESTTDKILQKPTLLLGNKADLDHRREVTHTRAELLAQKFGCCEREIAASAPWDVVSKPFVDIYSQVLKKRKLLIDQ